MNKIKYLFIGALLGAVSCATFIYATVGHYREPEHNRNMGYLDAQSDILEELEKHFGKGGVFPGATTKQVEPTQNVIFGLKSSHVNAAEKDGVPTLYIH